MLVDSPVATFTPVPFADEDARIVRHFLEAERHCRANAHDSVGAASLLRSLLLDELAEYRTDARFPRHHIAGEFTPVFVDAYGTRCAVGHLLEVCGEHDLVGHVASERNLARVRELASESKLVSWLGAVGITVDEAARIQPSYCTTPAVEACNDCNWTSSGYDTATAVADAHVVAVASTGQLAVSVDAMYGAQSNVGVGSQLEVYRVNGSATDQVIGTRVVVAIPSAFSSDAGTGYSYAIPALVVSSSGYVSCYESAPRIEVADFAAAKLSSDCEATLSSRGGSWNHDTCDGEGLRACSTSSAPSTSVDILLAAVPALVALAVARRRSRRR